MLSAEARLVYRTADPHFGPEECAATVTEVRDWERVLAILEREGATSSVWGAIKASGVAVPADVAEVLKARALQKDLRMQRLSVRLQHTVRQLRSGRIPVLLLKGSAYAAMFDPTLRSRAMNDIDLLVRREDVSRARAAVVAAGWPETRDPGLLELLKDAHHLPHFVDPQDPQSRLELHVAVLPVDNPFAFDEATLWNTAVPASGPLEGALMPSPERMLLHACVHFAWQHTASFGAWKTFRLVSAVIGHPDFEWPRFVELASQSRASTSAYWTLRLMERLAGVTVNGNALTDMAPPTPEPVRSALERHFVSSIAVGEGPRSPSVRLTRWLWIAALRPRWSGHPSPGRSEPGNPWAVTFGVASTESRAARLRRHLLSLHDWWAFLRRTLTG